MGLQIWTIFILACLSTTTTNVFSFVVVPAVQKQLTLSKNSVAVSKTVPPSNKSQFDRQRRSVANVQMMGLFGLGAPEIAVILVAAAFLLGPQKLAELGKDAGKIAGELKEVPKEFQAGLKEGEQAAQLAKQQQTIPDAAIEEKKE